ncbi:MAG: Gfo/Idh/MocA family oxidoreductase, partial [Bacteroidota bacterium]
MPRTGEKARIGIVGLGSIAQTIHLPLLSRFSDAEILAVCDIDRSKAAFVAEKYRIPRFYTDLDEMLKQEDEITG